MVDTNKRNFLRGKLHPSSNGKSNSPPLYPPWALPVQQFLEVCTHCSECINHCPENIIVKGDGGFPEIDFQKGECTFCGECVDVCDSGALLKHNSKQQPWRITAHIKDTCLTFHNVTCSRCADECESRSIKLNYSVHGISTPEVNNDNCTGCGACVGVCPVSAIAVHEKSL